MAGVDEAAGSRIDTEILCRKEALQIQLSNSSDKRMLSTSTIPPQRTDLSRRRGSNYLTKHTTNHHAPRLTSTATYSMTALTLSQDLVTSGITKRPTCSVLVLTKPVKGELDQKKLEKLKADDAQVCQKGLNLILSFLKSELHSHIHSFY